METQLLENYDETERIVEIIQTLNYILHKKGIYVGIYDTSYVDIDIPVEEEYETIKTLFYELNSLFTLHETEFNEDHRYKHHLMRLLTVYDKEIRRAS